MTEVFVFAMFKYLVTLVALFVGAWLARKHSPVRQAGVALLLAGLAYMTMRYVITPMMWEYVAARSHSMEIR